MPEERTIKRRRKCEDCGFRWSTWEVSLQDVNEFKISMPQPYRDLMTVIDGWEARRIMALVEFIKTFERNHGEETPESPVQGRTDV